MTVAETRPPGSPARPYARLVFAVSCLPPATIAWFGGRRFVSTVVLLLAAVAFSTWLIRRDRLREQAAIIAATRPRPDWRMYSEILNDWGGIAAVDDAEQTKEAP